MPNDDAGKDAEIDAAKVADNVKAEFDRKFNNIKEQTDITNTKIDNLMETIIQQNRKQDLPPAKKEDPIDPDLEPGRYVDSKLSGLDAKIAQAVTSATSKISERDTLLNSMVNKYPELGDPNSELYKATVKNHENLGEGLHGTSAGYKLAIYDAVEKVGSKKKESSDVEEFIGGGGGDGGSFRRPPKKSATLDPLIVETAKIMGLDVEDKKVMERIKKRSERTSWSKWRGDDNKENR